MYWYNPLAILQVTLGHDYSERVAYSGGHAGFNASGSLKVHRAATIPFVSSPQQLLVVFQYVAGHRYFYRVVLGKSGVPAFVARMREYLAAFALARFDSLRAFYSAVPLVDNLFISEYTAEALLSILTWWLENGLLHSPEYLADRFTWLSVLGTYRMTGIEPPSLDSE